MAPGDAQWWEWGPLFHAVNTNKRGITLDLTQPAGRDVALRLLATADLVFENYTPRVMEQFGLDWDRLHQVNPRVNLVRMPAFGLDGPWRDRPGFAQTMESLTGMASLTGWPGGSPVLAGGVGDPIAGLHATFAGTRRPARPRPERARLPDRSHHGRSGAQRRGGGDHHPPAHRRGPRAPRQPQRHGIGAPRGVPLRRAPTSGWRWR